MINGNMSFLICNYKKEKDGLESPAVFQTIFISEIQQGCFS